MKKYAQQDLEVELISFYGIIIEHVLFCVNEDTI
jgi:hypothetical protein